MTEVERVLESGVEGRLSSSEEEEAEDELEGFDVCEDFENIVNDIGAESSSNDEESFLPVFGADAGAEMPSFNQVDA